MYGKHLFVVSITLAIGLILTAACGSVGGGTPTALGKASPAANPVTVKDDLGKTLTFDKVPTRIVSLAPSNTEIVFALGLGERLVGVTDFCNYPAQAKDKPKVGGAKPSLEQIVAAQPDLVLAISETAGAPEIATRLEDLKIKVLVLGPKNMDGILNDIQLVGQATGATQEAAKLVDEMRGKLKQVADKVKTAASKPRVMYELDATDPSKPFVPGPGSFIDGLITLAGGSNIAADAKLEWAQLSLEEVLKKNPQIIVLGDANYGTTAEQVMRRPGWSGIEAVKAGAVKPIDDDLISRPGPRVADGLLALAKLVHPELFP